MFCANLDSDGEDDTLVENPLVVDVLTKEESSKRKTDFWFQKVCIFLWQR